MFLVSIAAIAIIEDIPNDMILSSLSHMFLLFAFPTIAISVIN